MPLPFLQSAPLVRTPHAASTSEGPSGAFELLAAIVGAALPGGSPAEAVPGTDEEWSRLVGLAQYHGVLPFVQAHSLPDLPAGIAEALRRDTIARTMRSLALEAEAVRLGAVLAEARIPFLILKGLALRDAYGSLALRPFSDNDVLVDPADFWRLERTLVSDAGYVREHRTPWRKRGYVFVHRQYTFGRIVGNTTHTLDAHASVMPLGYPYAESAKSLLERSRTTAVGEAHVRTPSWEDLLVILCVNGLKDRWTRLRLVADVVAVASRVDDWAAAARIARRARSLGPVRLGLSLAAEIFGTPVPEALGVMPPAQARLAAEALTRLRVADAAAPLTERERVRLFLTAQDTLPARMRYVAYTAIRRATEPLLRGTGVASAEL